MSTTMPQVTVPGSAQAARAEPDNCRENAGTHGILQFPGGQNA